MEDKYQSYKTCFVPTCRSTTIRTPKKTFLHVPEKKELRNLWFAAVGRSGEITRRTAYCCEDHFNLKEDLMNYHIYSLIGGRKFIKKGVLPHLNLDPVDEEQKYRFNLIGYPINASVTTSLNVEEEDIDLETRVHQSKRLKLNDSEQEVNLSIVKEEKDISDCDTASNIPSFEQIYFPEQFDSTATVKCEIPKTENSDEVDASVSHNKTAKDQYVQTSGIRQTITKFKQCRSIGTMCSIGVNDCEVQVKPETRTTSTSPINFLGK